MKHDKKEIEEILEENDFDNLSLESKIRAEDSMKQYAEDMVQQRDKLWEDKLTKLVQYDDSYLGTVVFAKDVADIIKAINQEDHE